MNPVEAAEPVTTYIFAVDPGIANCGWAILRLQGVDLQLLDSGIITTDKLMLRHLRTAQIVRELGGILRPPVKKVWLAIEDVAWSRNVSSALTTAAVIGAVEAWAVAAGIDCMAFGPTEVKRVVGGSGRSDKARVANGVRRMLSLDGPVDNEHKTDAAAIGITCAVMALGYKLPA